MMPVNLFWCKSRGSEEAAKKIKVNPTLALQLYDSGLSDAMYLAGLITHSSLMTKEQLIGWAAKAYWYMLSEYTVAKVTAENKSGYELTLEWIQSDKENIASAGWVTLTNLGVAEPGIEPDLEKIKYLLEQIRCTIYQSPNRVHYTLSGFVIAVGSYIDSLSAIAVETGCTVGEIKVDMGGTACKVPYAPDYIQKVKQRGITGRKVNL